MEKNNFSTFYVSGKKYVIHRMHKNEKYGYMYNKNIIRMLLTVCTVCFQKCVYVIFNVSVKMNRFRFFRNFLENKVSQCIEQCSEIIM